MAKKSIDIELNLKDKDAQRKLKAATKEVGQLEDSLDDAESAGKQLARAIEQSADDMIDEIDRTKRAVDAMERALDGTDMDSREVVADLKRIGLTAEEIEADADALADALRRAGDVKVHAVEQGFDDVDQALGRTRDEVGRTGDAMTGFIGGTVGELPGISEAMGPVAEGLGQLTEGAIEGEVSLKQMAVAGMGIAGVAFVMDKVNKHFARLAEHKAWRREQVDSYVDALRDAEDAAGAVADKLRDAEEITVSIGQGMMEFDALPALAAAGLTVDEFAQLVAGGEEKVRQFIDAIEASGGNAEDYALVIAAARQEAKFLGDAQLDASVKTAVFGEATEEAAEATQSLDRRTRDLTAAIDENLAAVSEAVEQRYAMEDATYAARKAERDWWQTMGEVNEALEANKEGSLEYADAVDRGAQETAAMVRAQLTAAGVNLDTARGQRAYTNSLVDTALAMKGPVAREILAHIGRLNGIPEEKITEAQALMDAGSVERAKQLINRELSKTTAHPQVVPAGLEAARARLEAILGRAVNIGVNTYNPSTSANVRYRATGGVVGPGETTVVGERRPEVAEFPPGTRIHPNGTGPRAGATVINNITQNFPAGMRPTDVIDAQRRWERRNGPR